MTQACNICRVYYYISRCIKCITRSLPDAEPVLVPSAAPGATGRVAAVTQACESSTDRAPCSSAQAAATARSPFPALSLNRPQIHSLATSLLLTNISTQGCTRQHPHELCPRVSAGRRSGPSHTQVGSSIKESGTFKGKKKNFGTLSLEGSKLSASTTFET